MNGFRLLRVFIVTTLVVLSISLAGCCIGGIGGGKKEVRTESQNISTTLGDELRDLKAAYDEGIITEKQYQESKERIMKQRAKGK
jgi:hypothetical protein